VKKSEFDKCVKEYPYDSLYGDKPNQKYVRSKHKTKPFCVRCRPQIDKESSIDDIINVLANFASRLGPGKTTRAEDLLEEKQVNELRDAGRVLREKFPDTPATGPSAFIAPPAGCLDSLSSIPEGHAYRFKRGKNVYCGSIDDDAVKGSNTDYHHLVELDNMRKDKNVSWPESDLGRPFTTDEVYDRAALCAQLNKEEECENDSKSSFLPLSLRKGIAKNMCTWKTDLNLKHNGSCEPTFVDTGRENSLDGWWGKFRETEKKLANDNRSKQSIRWNRE
jgi:hypothetical protein